MPETAKSVLINPYLAVMLAVGAVSFGSIFTRLATAPPLVIAFYRMGFTVLLLLPLVLTRNGLRELKSIGTRDLAMAILSGIFLAMHFLVWITSLRYTSIASSTVLVTMQPLFVVSFGYLFLKEKTNRVSALAAAVSLGGCVLVGAGDFQIGGQALLGDLLAFSGAFFIAVYVMIGRNLRARLTLFPYVVLVYGTAAVFLFIINIFVGVSLYPYPTCDWLMFLALALVPTILGHTVFNWALRYVKAMVVSVSILGEPVGATLLGLIIFAEVPGMLQVLGGLVIIIGLYWFITRARAGLD